MKPATFDKMTYLVIIAAGVFYIFISCCIFEMRPNSFDEFGYWIQAKIFSEGSFYIKANNFSYIFIEPHIVYERGILFSKYFPGFSLLLAGAIKLGLAFVLNPILMCLSLFFVYRLSKDLTNEKNAAIIILLGAFVPYSFGYAASLFAQPLILFISTAGIWAFYEYLKQSQKKNLFYIGIFAALGFLTRPVETACFLFPILIGLVHYHGVRKSLVPILITTTLAIIGIGLVISYNSYQLGKFSLTTYGSHINTELHILGKWQDVFRQFFSNFNRFFYFLFYDQFLLLIGLPAFLLFMLGLYKVFRTKYLYVLFLHIFLIVFIYTFHSKDGWPQYGSRYWFAFWGSFLLICSLGWPVLQQLTSWLGISGKWQKVLALILITCQLVYLYTSIPQTLERYQFRVQMMSNAKHNMIKTCPEQSLVFLIWHTPDPVIDRERFIEDMLLKQNLGSDRKRLIIGPYKEESLQDPKLMRRITFALKKNPGFKICPYKVDYR